LYGLPLRAQSYYGLKVKHVVPITGAYQGANVNRLKIVIEGSKTAKRFPNLAFEYDLSDAASLIIAFTVTVIQVYYVLEFSIFNQVAQGHAAWYASRRSSGCLPSAQQG
jgi:hypothetical protein